MKCYVELPCNNVKDISEQIYQYLKNNTGILNTAEYGWHFVDCTDLLKNAPDLIEYFKENKLLPRHAAITIATENAHLFRHTDAPPVIAKINFPVINTAGWVNRWYIDDKIVAELLDMQQPIVFNSSIEHGVERITATQLPRIVASFTFNNEPLKWLE